MKDFIYQKDLSLDGALCDRIIEIFETNKDEQFKGVLGGSYGLKSGSVVDIITKDTTDCNIISSSARILEWQPIICILIKELEANLQNYIEKLETTLHLSLNDIYKSKAIDTFLIHKYEKGKGKFLYHNDFYIDRDRGKYRILNYMWYLNDVIDGGETEFFGYYKIKPQKGKMIIFPSEWFFPHCGKMPISDDKYVITGWVYVDM